LILRRPAPLLLLSLLALSAAGCGRSSPPPLNVLLISIDSLVRNRLGIYGHHAEYAPTIPVSPNLDALAAEGVVFDDAWSTTSWTLPSHEAIFTGLSDRSHAVETDDYTLDPLRRTMVQEFHDAGYRTAGFYSGPYLDPKWGLGRGFDRYESAMMTPEALARSIQTWARKREAAGFPKPTAVEIKQVRDDLSHRDVTSGRVNGLAEDFLDHRGGKPFFLFLHYFDAHYDYIPDLLEPGLGKRFDPGYQGEMSGDNWYWNPAVRDQKSGKRRISERDLHHVEALYDAEIHWVDRHIGRIIDSLKRRGLWENTLVCVLSDHGDEFFEHGSIGHRSTLYPELTQIPLILRVPRATPPGKRVAAFARSIDVAPTLLDFALHRDMPEAEGRSLRELIDGSGEPRSLLQRMVGSDRPRDGWRDQEFAVQRTLSFDPKASRRTGLLTMRQARDRSGRPILEVYDRNEDPRELHPLAPTDPRYREALTRFHAAWRQGEARAEALPQSPRPQRYAEVLSAEDRATLAAMGYTDSGFDTGPERRLPQLAPFPEPTASGRSQ